MRRIVSALVLLLSMGAASTAFADPLFDFTITGGGHTFQFATPEPAPVDHTRGGIFVRLTAPGTVDGVSGYTFGAVLQAPDSYYAGAYFVFGFQPTSPGSGLGSGSYDLGGTSVLSLVKVIPFNFPGCTVFGEYCDLRTYAFVTGEHNFFGDNANRYNVDIVQEDGTATTPEPGTWVLLGTGASGLLALLRGRRRPERSA